MLLVGLATSDAALHVLASADDKPGLAGTTDRVTPIAERSMALKVEISETPALQPVAFGA